MAKKIEVFSAGCSTCKETIEVVKRLAGSSHEVVIHDMQKSEVASKAKRYGVRSVPAVVIDGKLAECCTGRRPDEHLLRSALAWDLLRTDLKSAASLETRAAFFSWRLQPQCIHL
jgi:glutaredoxin